MRIWSKGNSKYRLRRRMKSLQNGYSVITETEITVFLL